MTSRLSNALQITDLNDFLSPSATCVLPLEGGAVSSAAAPSDVAAGVRREPAGSVLTPIVSAKGSMRGKTKAAVTVSDCLACSGCVTSADAVLLSTESLDKLKRLMLQNSAGRHEKYAVAALSQQAVASIAVFYNMTLNATARKLSTFLREDVGFDTVVDLSFGRHLSLLEASAEFLRRYRNGQELTIASACPGFVTYAEKTQDVNILECISSIKSSQGIVGTVAKKLLAPNDKRSIWLCSIAQCHDKKIEAHRPELIRGANGSEDTGVDCVLTAGELLDFVKERRFDLINAKETALDDRMCASSSAAEFGVKVGSNSDGYADFILRAAAKELLGVELADGPLTMEKRSKSGDQKSITVRSKDGTRQLSFATAYGYRSLQSILRKMRRGECTYNYVELMACPGGCNNGGGQVTFRPDSKQTSTAGTAKQQADRHLAEVDERFFQAPVVRNPLALKNVGNAYTSLIGDVPGSRAAQEMLTMKILSRKDVGPTSLVW